MGPTETSQASHSLSGKLSAILKVYKRIKDTAEDYPLGGGRYLSNLLEASNIDNMKVENLNELMLDVYRGMEYLGAKGGLQGYIDKDVVGCLDACWSLMNELIGKAEDFLKEEATQKEHEEIKAKLRNVGLNIPENLVFSEYIKSDTLKRLRDSLENMESKRLSYIQHNEDRWKRELDQIVSNFPKNTNIAKTLIENGVIIRNLNVGGESMLVEVLRTIESESANQIKTVLEKYDLISARDDKKLEKAQSIKRAYYISQLSDKKIRKFLEGNKWIGFHDEPREILGFKVGGYIDLIRSLNSATNTEAKERFLKKIGVKASYESICRYEPKRHVTKENESDSVVLVDRDMLKRVLRASEELELLKTEIIKLPMMSRDKALAILESAEKLIKSLDLRAVDLETKVKVVESKVQEIAEFTKAEIEKTIKDFDMVVAELEAKITEEDGTVDHPTAKLLLNFWRKKLEAYKAGNLPVSDLLTLTEIIKQVKPKKDSYFFDVTVLEEYKDKLGEVDGEVDRIRGELKKPVGDYSVEVLEKKIQELNRFVIEKQVSDQHEGLISRLEAEMEGLSNLSSEDKIIAKAIELRIKLSEASLKEELNEEGSVKRVEGLRDLVGKAMFEVVLEKKDTPSVSEKLVELGSRIDALKENFIAPEYHKEAEEKLDGFKSILGAIAQEIERYEKSKKYRFNRLFYGLFGHRETRAQKVLEEAKENIERLSKKVSDSSEELKESERMTYEEAKLKASKNPEKITVSRKRSHDVEGGDLDELYSPYTQKKAQRK